MPHIAIQLYPGRDGETKKRLAEAVLNAAAAELGRGREHFSVSIEDVPQDEWKERVYDKVLADGNTVIPPEYEL
ncbi:MAG: tautomerase family protein [Treponemataceae bacterium]|nr:tautomerase family protein [Treponemataceae bacterium]